MFKMIGIGLMGASILLVGCTSVEEPKNVKAESRKKSPVLAKIKAKMPSDVPKQRGVLKPVTFTYESSSSRLSDLQLQMATKLVDFLKDNPETVVQIEGHTDSEGSEAINRALSQRRAENLKAVLVQKYKIPRERMVARGYGSAQPISDNTTEEGRAQNRRVVIRVEAE